MKYVSLVSFLFIFSITKIMSLSVVYKYTCSKLTLYCSAGGYVSVPDNTIILLEKFLKQWGTTHMYQIVSILTITHPILNLITIMLWHCQQQKKNRDMCMINTVQKDLKYCVKISLFMNIQRTNRFFNKQILRHVLCVCYSLILFIYLKKNHI